MKTYLAHSLLSSHNCAHTVRAYVGIPTYDSCRLRIHATATRNPSRVLAVTYTHFPSPLRPVTGFASTLL